MFCRQQIAQLREWVEEFRGRGAELVVIGNGTVEQARAFRDAQALTFPLYTDPSLGAYRRAGLRSGLASSMHPGIALKALEALAGGFRQGTVQGHAMQQGGAFVIGKGGRLLYEYVSRHAGDHPDPAAVLRALGSERQRG